MVQLRDYQKVASRKLTRLCQIKKCAYLSGECRTGKTRVGEPAFPGIEQPAHSGMRLDLERQDQSPQDAADRVPGDCEILT